MTRKVAEGFYMDQGKYYDSNIYIFLNEENKILLIDSGSGDFKNQPELALWNVDLKIKDVEKIIFTHKHYDHIGGARKLPHAKLYCGYGDLHAIRNGDESILYHVFNARPIKYENIEPLKEGDKIIWGEFELLVLETPGHTMGSISLYEPNKKWIFSGDALFGDGNLPNPMFSEDYGKVFDSIDKIMDLDWEYLFPGHGLPGTKEEIKSYLDVVLPRLRKIYKKEKE